MVKQELKRQLEQFKGIKYSVPWGPYKRISNEDEHSFAPVLKVWRPENDMPTILLRWLITEWCNYNCPYCPQTHDRFAPKKNEYTAHAFDNHSRIEWEEAFSRHFKRHRLSLVITGGEPLLDRKNMVPFLKTLTALPTVECIRIDTNASWSPNLYREIDLSKIILMCTYHPSGVTETAFLDRIDQALDAGFKIGMVNFVMSRENFNKYKDFKIKMAERDIPLHPNPLWDSKGNYSKDDLFVLQQELPAPDYFYRTNIGSPYDKKCLFPAVAYEMDQTGRIQVGCHPQVVGSFFDHRLPDTFAGPAPCPMNSCNCLDMYSFLKDVNRNKSRNPLQVYSDILKQR